MNLPETVTFSKDGHIESPSWRIPLFRKLFLSVVILLIASLSFGIGRLSVTGERKGVSIEYDTTISNSQFPISNSTQASVSNAASVIENSTYVVGSKNGTKYHYTHCPGAKQIKEENKIVFASPSDAEASGYTLAANCSPK